ncbi:hypothetical protein ES705_46683 [subsurface metagenome]
MKCYVNAQEKGTILDLNKRDDLILVTDSQDVSEIKNYFGDRAAVKEFDAFFVKVGEGDFVEVYGFHGIVPNLEKTVWQIERTCK